MKIAFLGGKRHAAARDYLEGYDKSKLDKVIEVDAPSGESAKNFQTYLLKIIKMNGEFKYFYVLNSLTGDDVKSYLDECWSLSDNIGYDFD